MERTIAGVGGLLLDAFFLWNAHRLWKKDSKGWAGLFGVMGVSGAVANIYFLVKPEAAGQLFSSTSVDPQSGLMVSRMAGYSADPAIRRLPGGGIDAGGMVFGPDNAAGLPIVALRY